MTLENNTITIEALTAGRSTITVTDNRSGEKVEIELTVKSGENSLELSHYSVTVNDGEYATVEITSGSGSYSVQSSDAIMLWLKLEGSTLTIKGREPGTASVTVTDTETQETAIITVEVIATYDETLCPDNQHPHMIDMGNGVKWACCNVGTRKPEGYGSLFAWGEVEEKEMYSWATYELYNGDNTFKDISSDISGTQYDVAHVKWGAPWRMPTVEEMTNLKKNTDGEVCRVNGRSGVKLTSKITGNAIFIPFDGWCTGAARLYADGIGDFFYLWTSTIDNFEYNPYDACVLYGSSRWKTWYVDNESRFANMQCYRYIGRSVRPVSD